MLLGSSLELRKNNLGWILFIYFFFFNLPKANRNVVMLKAVERNGRIGRPKTGWEFKKNR